MYKNLAKVLEVKKDTLVIRDWFGDEKSITSSGLEKVKKGEIISYEQESRNSDVKNVKKVQMLSDSMRMSCFLDIQEKWNMEAMEEAEYNYLFETQQIKNVLYGNKYIILGRKGSGKTAVGQFMLRKYSENPNNNFCKRFTFSDFIDSELIKFKEEKVSRSSAYINFWKYLIYQQILRMISKNANISYEVRKKLQVVEIPDISNISYQNLKKVINFDVKAMGMGISSEVVSESVKFELSEKVEIMEEFFETHDFRSDNSQYALIFDDFDHDDYDKSDKIYFDVLASLFKAVQEIRGFFKEREIRVKTIILLRSDIYDQIKSPNKNKWSSNVLQLTWDFYYLFFDLLAYRIAKSLGVNYEDYDPIHLIAQLFTTDYINDKLIYNRQKQLPLLHYMRNRSLGRPRDIIMWLITCASICVRDKQPYITTKVVLEARKEMAKHYIREFEDELQGNLTEPSIIFDVLRALRKHTFSDSEFVDTTDRISKTLWLEKNGGIDELFSKMYHYDIIGHKERTSGYYNYYSLSKIPFERNYSRGYFLFPGLLGAIDTQETEQTSKGNSSPKITTSTQKSVQQKNRLLSDGEGSTFKMSELLRNINIQE